jgi:TolB-like protein/Flp pilus assembly protein TadD
MTPDIFLSYTREDQATAHRFAEAFEAQGFSVWWDVTLRSGEAYDQVTEAALRGAKVVVVLWSPRSVESRWVRAEATIAERNGTLTPAMIEPCERPVMFELTQTAELSHWRGDAADKIWMAFLSDVWRKVGRDSPAGAAAPVPPSAASGAPSVVAVLPFTHRAGEEDMQDLAEDLTDEITRELAQARYFEVIAAGTMAAWRDKPIDYRALGRELDARYLIEGRLQRAGEAARLTVQLIDTATGRMLWSQRIARKLADIDAAPEEFPLSVAAELGEHILQIETSRAMGKSGPYSAWEHLLRSMAYAARSGTESTRRATQEARHAVAAAPDLGLAHAMLASSLSSRIADHGEALDETLSREIQAHISRALQLDGDNRVVIAWLAPAYLGLGDAETYLRLSRRAVELYPHSPASHHLLGDAYMALGRTADAIAAYTQQDRLTAFYYYFGFHALSQLGWAYILEGRRDEAEAAIDRALALHPEFHAALKWKAILLAHRGEEQAALATVRRVREVEPTISIDQHVRQMMPIPRLDERSAEHVATLRRLWDATGTVSPTGNLGKVGS